MTWPLPGCRCKPQWRKLIYPCAAEAQSTLLKRSVQAYQRSLELTQNHYRGGVAMADDVAHAQTQLKTTSAQRILPSVHTVC